MPAVGSAIITAVGSFLTAGFTQSVTATLFQLGARAALTVGLNAVAGAFAGKPKPAQVQSPGMALNFAPNPNGPRKVIYGELGVAGQPIYDATTDSNKYYHVISDLGDGGPYDSIQSIQLNGETVTLDGSGNITSPAKWASKARIETKLGTLAQTAFSNAVSEITEWTTDHRGRGVALSYMRFEYDPEAWSTGRPRPLFVLRGRTAIYDPRLDSSPGNDPSNASYHAWTQNPALWALDYIRGVYVNGQRILGLGIPDALIDWDSFSDAADVCDEAVTVKAGGTIPRYSGGGCEVTADDNPLSVLELFMSAMGGVITTRSGKIACYAAEAQTATVTLTDDDWAGAVKVTTGASIRETANAVSIQYTEPSLGYEWTDAPPYRNSTWETEDGNEELWTPLPLGTVQDHRVGQRLAKIYAGDKREPHRIEALCKIKAIQIQEGEVFTLDSDSYGSAVNGKFRLVKRTVNPDGTVSIVARSETDAKYDWTAASEERDAPTGSITTISAPTTPTPTGWTATAVNYNGPQGATYAAINIAISGTIPPTIGQVEIQVKRQAGDTLGFDFIGGQFGVSSSGATGDGDYVPIATLDRVSAQNGYRINGLEWARGYSVRVRYISYFNVTGSWQTIEVAVGVGSGAVTAPSGWTASAGTLTGAEGYTRPVLTVSAPSAGVPAEAGVVAIDYRKTTDSDFTGQVVLTRADASRGYNLPAEVETDYIVRVRYGADAATWGASQTINVSTSATAAISLASFAVAANATTDGTYTQPGFKATWTALAGDELRRANAIALEYRRNGDTEVSKIVAEPDAASVNVWGLLPGVVYNVRARVEEVYQAGAWTSWENVTVGSTFLSSGFNGQGNLATFNTLDWTDSEFTGRPTELTDGRVGAGLASNGDIARNIPGSIKTGSDILSRSGGGTFTGDLTATEGATWGGNLSGRPTELTDGRIATALNASGVLQTNIANASQIPSLPATQIGSGTFDVDRVPTLDASTKITAGTIANAQVSTSAAIDYSKIVYPKQAMDANLDTPIATSFSGGSYTEVLRVSFADVDENHLINLGGTKLKLRDGGTGAASGVCSIFWKIIANNASGTETNQLVIADGELAIIETGVGTGEFVPTADGTSGGTQLPGGPLLSWKAIRDLSTVAQDAFFTLESGVWSYPLTNLYISVWMQADSGETGYIETATAGDCVLNVGGLGELENP